MKIRSGYMPFIVIFLLCSLIIIVISTIKTNNSGLISIDADQLDTTRKDWFYQKTEDGQRPIFPEYVGDYAEKYKAYYIGEEKKILFLTFNCGYEYENYTLDFLDILQENDVKAAFFITGEYLRKNPVIVNKMIDEGHIVGNHGNTHADLSKLDAESIRKEILDFEVSYAEVTGSEYTKKFFRPASGTYTELALAVAKELDYTTVFWSMAYEDWNTENQLNSNIVLDKIIKDSHDGCVFMFHTVSKSNKDVIGQGISELKSIGYVFKGIEKLSNN